MKIGVTSENKLKVNAVERAYSTIKQGVEVSGYSANSGVGEQPVNDQALTAARNRILDVKSRANRLDRIVSIESGIFRVGDKWLDKAVVVIYNPSTGTEHVAYSASVIFPDRYVELARARGFDKITAGQVMEEEGYVTNRKDPHLAISGTSREEFIQKTVRNLVAEIEQ